MEKTYIRQESINAWRNSQFITHEYLPQYKAYLPKASGFKTVPEWKAKKISRRLSRPHRTKTMYESKMDSKCVYIGDKDSIVNQNSGLDVLVTASKASYERPETNLKVQMCDKSTQTTTTVDNESEKKHGYDRIRRNPQTKANQENTKRKKIDIERLCRPTAASEIRKQMRGGGQLNLDVKHIDHICGRRSLPPSQRRFPEAYKTWLRKDNVDLKPQTMDVNTQTSDRKATNKKGVNKKQFEFDMRNFINDFNNNDIGKIIPLSNGIDCVHIEYCQ